MKTEETNQMATRIIIERTAFTQDEFDSTFEVTAASSLLPREVVSKWFHKKCTPSKTCLAEKVLSFFPFIMMLRYFNWRQDILTDIVSGLACGVTHVPMGIAFTYLVGVPPVYGLYSALFPVFAYFLVGGSRHISVHTMALTALLVGVVVDREVLLFKLESSAIENSTEIMSSEPLNGSSMGGPSLSNNTNIVNSFSVEIAASVTLMAGAFQVLMSVFRLGGALGTYMSVPYVSGFLTGACCHIILSQIPLVLGVRLERVTGVGELPIKVFRIIRGIGKSNPATVICGLCCIVFLVIIKEIINLRFSHKLKIPIPAEIIVVVVCSTISYVANLKVRFGIATVTTVPLGLPAPVIPSFTNAENYIVDAIVIALISYVISLSLAKSYARKYKYQIDTNSEMFAFGVSNVVGGFFSCFAGAAAPPICCVQDTSRGKSQIVSLVSCTFVLIICLVAGPLLEPLPTSALGAIVIVALLPIFRRLSELKLLWRLNKWDVAVWLTTWLLILGLDVTYGAAIGMVFNVVVLTIKHKTIRGVKFSRAGSTEIYVPRDRYSLIKSSNNVLVYFFGTSLVFVNADSFKDDLFKLIGKEELAAKVDAFEKAMCTDVPVVDKSTRGKIKPGNGEIELSNNLHEKRCANKCIAVSGKYEEKKQQDYISNHFDCKIVQYIKQTHTKTNGNEVKSNGMKGYSKKQIMHSDNQDWNNYESKEPAVNGNGVLLNHHGMAHTNDETKIEICNGKQENFKTSDDGNAERNVTEKLGSKKCTKDKVINNETVHTIIVDCSAIGFIDIVGLNTLSQVCSMLEARGVKFVLAQCTPGLLSQLRAVEFSGTKFKIYPTVHDAIITENSQQC